MMFLKLFEKENEDNYRYFRKCLCIRIWSELCSDKKTKIWDWHIWHTRNDSPRGTVVIKGACHYDTPEEAAAFAASVAIQYGLMDEVK